MKPGVWPPKRLVHKPPERPDHTTLRRTVTGQQASQISRQCSHSSMQRGTWLFEPSDGVHSESYCRGGQRCLHQAHQWPGCTPAASLRLSKRPAGAPCTCHALVQGPREHAEPCTSFRAAQPSTATIQRPHIDLSCKYLYSTAGVNRAPLRPPDLGRLCSGHQCRVLHHRCTIFQVC